MTEKILNTRIQLRYDTYENWTKTEVAGQGANLVLKEGEVGICAIPTGTKVNGIKNPPHVMMKIGDGVTPFASLNWLSGRAADVEDWAKAETKPVYSAEEITGIGEYIAKYVDEELGISIDTNTVYQIVKVDDNHYKLQSKAAGTDAWADVAGSEIVIPESTKVEASTTNGNIKVDGEEVKVYDDIFVTDIKTVNGLGGIAANTDLNGLTTNQILNKLLFPYVDASVGNATATPNGGTYEKGSTKTITQVKITVTKKSEPITSVALYNGSELIEEKTGDAVKNGGTITFSNVNVDVPSEGNQLTVKVTYPDASGNAKVVAKSTTALTFVYPYYKGVCAEGAIIDETLVSGLTKVVEDKGNKTDWSYTCNNQCIVFAYPKAHNNLTKIVDPNNFDVTGSFTKHEVSVTGLDGTAQTYYVYVNGASTVSGFTVNFKY
jgi:hypothetical protein